ncbi:MAG TPA: DISARM system phospholipase D-like protein DrmC [Polyangiaceae bacterium]|nr:DISARM system phospholipase D-like protein DrmC [Polyangiaceae bacterium]
MSAPRGNLAAVATSTLERLRAGIATGALPTPIDRAALTAFGVKNQLEALDQALAGHQAPACLAILDVVLAERAARRPAPELVWTGPEGPAATARDTAVVLRALFEAAREHVILAGYSFDHARDVLAPLHAVMRDHGVEATFFVDVPQTERHLADPEAHVAEHLGNFTHHNWPFGPPLPRLYYDRRCLTPGPPFSSLHAKCVTVDGLRAFVSSANFTQRGQERNIEVGVLVEDPVFASSLAGQWMGLIEGGIVRAWDPAG